MPRIAILHPTDPLGHVPGGIDTIIRGLLKHAPQELEYVLVGATSDVRARPVGKAIEGLFGNPSARFLPLVVADAQGRKSAIPLTARYLASLYRFLRGEGGRDIAVFDFHRMEPLLLFRGDARPKNMTMHQDMEVLRQKDCDILWRHAPWMYEWLESRLFAGLDRLWCVRQSAAERYRRVYPGLAGRTEFLPTWVDSDTFHLSSTAARQEACRSLRTQLGITPSTRVLTSVGRLDRQKDPILMLESFSDLHRRRPDTHLLLIGDGDMRSQVEQAISDMELQSSITLPGVKRPEQIADILRGSDLFVLSSAYEGMPIAVLEALASGIPVVTTDVGEVRLVVRNGESGAVSATRTPNALADAMDAVLGQLHAYPPAQCSKSVAAYRDKNILARLYDNHRRQVGMA